MKTLQAIAGIIVFPISWVIERLFKGRPSSPPEFWMFMKELRDRGVKGHLQMQDNEIAGIDRSAIVVLDAEPSRMKAINLFRCDSADVAQKNLREIQSNEAMSHGKQRDRYLMSVTFMNSDEELANLVIESFDTFELPPGRSPNRRPEPQSGLHNGGAG
jgi:hypothetical protein